MSLIVALLGIVVCVGMVCAVAPTHCCTTPQWSDRMQVITATLEKGSSKPSIVENAFQLEVDRDAKLLKVSGSYSTDGVKYTPYTVINHYAEGKSYKFGDHAGHSYCNVTDIDRNSMNDNCVPSTLNYTNTYTFGSGDESLRVHSWDGMYEDFYWSVQTSVADCSPVAYTRFGTNKKGVRIVESALSVDVVQKKTSMPASTFLVPVTCMNTGAHSGI